MKAEAHVAALAYVLCMTPLFAGEPVRPTIDFNDMRVVVMYVSASKLSAMQHHDTPQSDPHDIRPYHRHGFSILKRNRETGGLTCEIYISDAVRPRQVDDEATLILGHELLHCMLGDYHR